jgi:hypothetical protein
VRDFTGGGTRAEIAVRQAYAVCEKYTFLLLLLLVNIVDICTRRYHGTFHSFWPIPAFKLSNF